MDEGNYHTEMERSSEWLPWSSLVTLKLAFNVTGDDQGSQPDDLSASVHQNALFKVYHYWKLTS